jgi:hypothetical protein
VTRDPGPQWQRAEDTVGSDTFRLDRGTTFRVAIDRAARRIWCAPLGTPDPRGEGWLTGYLTASAGPEDDVDPCGYCRYPIPDHAHTCPSYTGPED